MSEYSLLTNVFLPTKPAKLHTSDRVIPMIPEMVVSRDEIPVPARLAVIVSLISIVAI